MARRDVGAWLYLDTDEHVARNRLRNLIHRLKQLPWGGGLDASPAVLAWTGETDLRNFRRACEAGSWAKALALYRGPLLEGQRPDGLPEVESWLDKEREEMQALWYSALLHHAGELEAGGQPRRALDPLTRALDHDPYAEEAMQAYLRCAAAVGAAREAAQRYGHFANHLRRDLGLEPAADTTRLYQLSQAVLQASRPATASPGRGTGTAPLTRRGLPTLLGRQTELAWLRTALDSPDIRLLTLVGPGGVGKTRLSLELLAHAAPATDPAPKEERRAFVALAAAQGLAAMVLALGAALELPSSPDPAAQVRDALRHTRALVVLDNLEHLLTGPERSEVLELVTGLLDEAPGLRLLVTSRLRLGLQAEQVLTLGGLDYPRTPELSQAARSGAVRLLVERGGRVRPGFALTPHNAADLVRLCQLTEGLPLALELTAAWLGTFGPGDLVTELEADLDLAHTDAPDRPERHRSLRAAFEYSWRLLSGPGQRALAALSVFRDGFSRPAALAVTGLGLRPLLELADHSLIRREPSGRFAVHEVVRQYAAERLAAQPDEEMRFRAAHATWYSAMAQQAEPLLRGPEQAEWLGRLGTEQENLRGAVQWTLAQGEAGPALRLTQALHWFWYVRGHLREGLGALRAALALPGGTAQERAQVLSSAGGLARDLGEYEQGTAELRGALDLVRAQQEPQPLLEAGARHGLGLLYREQGDFAAAHAFFGEALALQRQQGPQAYWALASTLNDLGITLALQKNLTGARPLFEESLRLKELLGDRQGVAYALGNLGNLAQTPEDFRNLTRQSLDIKRELGDLQGAANSLYNLADQNIDDGRFEEARAQLREALEVYWQLGRRRSVAATLTAFAKLAAWEEQSALSLHFAGAADALLEAAQLPAQGFGTGNWLERVREAAGDVSGTLYRQGHGAPLSAVVALALGQTASGDRSLRVIGLDS